MRLVNTPLGVGRLEPDHVAVLDLPHPDVTALLKDPDWRLTIQRSRVRATVAPTELASAAVVQPAAYWLVGTNYASKAAATGKPVPTRPSYFLRSSRSVCGPGTRIVLPTSQSRHVDYEGEVGIVLGARAHRIRFEDAWRVVAGVVACNDITARDLLDGGTGVAVAKSFAGFGVIGNVLATVDELNDRDDIALQTLVNGEVRQSSSTKEMVFGVAELVARLSWQTPLGPGDVISTGSPAGSGQETGRYLRAGDEVTVRVEAAGEVSVSFVEEPASVEEEVAR